MELSDRGSQISTRKSHLVKDEGGERRGRLLKQRKQYWCKGPEAEMDVCQCSGTARKFHMIRIE